MGTNVSLVKRLVIANRVLAHEDVIDAYGHVSVRDPARPDRFFLAKSRSAEFVDADDIHEYGLDGEPTDGFDGRSYPERYIHCAVYAARPDVSCVVHAHTEALLPFGLIDYPLQAVIHSVSDMGTNVPVWDIADKFGDDTSLLVTDMARGEDLAHTLGDQEVALMRGHGFVTGGRSIETTVRLCVFLARNARVILAAHMLGGQPKPLSDGEVAARRSFFEPDGPWIARAWEAWAARAGCAHLLAD